MMMMMIKHIADHDNEVVMMVMIKKSASDDDDVVDVVNAVNKLALNTLDIFQTKPKRGYIYGELLVPK